MHQKVWHEETVAIGHYREVTVMLVQLKLVRMLVNTVWCPEIICGELCDMQVKGLHGNGL